MPSQRPPHAGSAQPLRVDGWFLDPSSLTARKDGQVVTLRPQLMDIIVHLARRAGTTVSREELLDAIWPDRFIVEAGVTRCISELRQALGDDRRQPRIIRTISKRGYRLIAPVDVVDEPPAGPAQASAPDTRLDAAAATAWWAPGRRLARRVASRLLGVTMISS